MLATTRDTPQHEDDLMPRKAPKIPGAVAPADTPVETTDLPTASEAIAAEQQAGPRASREESAQDRANRLNKAQLTPEGWVCPQPKAK